MQVTPGDSLKGENLVEPGSNFKMGKNQLRNFEVIEKNYTCFQMCCPNISN